MKRISLMAKTDQQARQITLGRLQERVAEVVEQGVPLDAPLVEWYNPAFLRDELVFELADDIATASVDELISSMEHAPAGPYDRADAWDEIRRRLTALVEA